MRRVLVTGATGYIASQMLDDFRRRYELVLVDAKDRDRDGHRPMAPDDGARAAAGVLPDRPVARGAAGDAAPRSRETYSDLGIANEYASLLGRDCVSGVA